MSKKSGNDVLLENRKARFLYFLSDFMTAGLVLTASLSDSYVTLRNGEAYINNMHIAAYKDGTIWNQDPLRARKLLLTKQELRKLERELKGTGLTVVPTKVFLHHGYAKMEIALAQGKKAFDKRETIKQRDTEKAISRAIKEHGKGGHGDD